MLRSKISLSAALLVTAISGDSLATTGDQVFGKMDEAMTRAKSQLFEYEARTKEQGKEETVLLFRVWVKGKDFRRLEFLSPGDIKGMRILIRSPTQMHVYLPAFRKVRRVASHVKEQGFMGTAFSHEEMALASYGTYFTGKLVKETDKGWVIEGTRREGQALPFKKILISVRKDVGHPAEIKYFNDAGVHIKTETRLKYSCQGDICTPGLLRIVDHTRNEMRTDLIRKKWKPNADVDDSFFTVRSLQRGR